MRRDGFVGDKIVVHHRLTGIGLGVVKMTTAQKLTRSGILKRNGLLAKTDGLTRQPGIGRSYGRIATPPFARAATNTESLWNVSAH